MESELPRGQQARAIWRSLSPQARADAFAAASRGVAPADLGVAWAAAGYGRMVSRRLRVVRLLAPFGFVLLAIPIGALLVVDRASTSTVDVTMTALLVAILGGLVGLSLWSRRFQRLYSSGLLGIEASRLGPAGSSGVPSAASAWTTVPGESEFTVPYHAQFPIAAPAPTVVTDPVAAGVYEIPVRRGRIVVSLAILTAAALLLWFGVIMMWSEPHRETPMFSSVVTVVAAAVSLLVVLLLYAVGPAMRRPVAARFTPAGWEIPPLRISGAWDQVRSIRVRPLAARGAANPQLAAYRMVALIVDDPEQRITHLGPLRRRLIRSNIAKYGSPVVVVASPRRTLPVVEMVHLLRSYTAAPVDPA